MAVYERGATGVGAPALENLPAPASAWSAAGLHNKVFSKLQAKDRETLFLPGA